MTIPNGKLLYLENVYKSYGEKCVLDDIDLAVRAGEFCSLVGPSCCGKSTLLRIILGQEAATTGSVFIADESVGLPDPARGIVFQKYSLYPHLTVLENVMLGRDLEQWPVGGFWRRSEIRQEAEYYLEQVKLSDCFDKYPGELSGGMQQRAAIAQALIKRPKILLMDEPFGALDPGTREHLQIFLLELWEKYKMTIFFVTHDLEEAAFLATRLLVLSQFYTDGRGKGANRGSRIVADYPLPKHALSTDAKTSAEFGELIQRVRREGFDPAYVQHVTEFNLRHPDSFRTVNHDECKRLEET